MGVSETGPPSTGGTPAEATLAVVVPVYNNAGSIVALCDRLAALELPAGVALRVVFVIDGSPDDSAAVLSGRLGAGDLDASVVTLSRNFGSFAAIRAGLEHAVGDYFAVISADLQEPPELLGEFAERLHTTPVDVVLGRRDDRSGDPRGTRWSSSLYWRLYRRFVQPSMPPGGVDVFAVTAPVRDSLVDLRERNTSLVGQLLWLGYRRDVVGYDRQPRADGESGWTLRRKFRYLADSVFAFTDLPVRLLVLVGILGTLLVSVGGVVVTVAWAAGGTDVPGYTPLMLAILFVGFVCVLGLGIVGSYVWRTYENSKRRPVTVTRSVEPFPASAADPDATAVAGGPVPSAHAWRSSDG